jgi:hypothetical protein
MREDGTARKHGAIGRTRHQTAGDDSDWTRSKPAGDAVASPLINEEGYGMTSMAQRIKGVLNRPQGRRLMKRGRQQAATPGTQQKLRQLAQRITGRSGRGR